MFSKNEITPYWKQQIFNVKSGSIDFAKVWKANLIQEKRDL